MPKILAITEAMHSNAKNVLARAGEIQSSHNEMARIAGGMTPYFSGTLPELLTRRLLDMKKKHDALYEKIAQYSGKIDYAADNYDWSDREIAGWATRLGVGVETIRNPGGAAGGTNPIMPGEEIKVGYQVPRDSIYYGSPNNPFSRGQCTWYAFGRSQELTGKQVQWLETSGRHGGLWPEKASNLAAVEDVPSAGSIMTWIPGMGGTAKLYGHVAVVEKVEPIYNSNGEISDYNILYSQANWDNNVNVEDPQTDGLIAQPIKLSELSQKGINLWNIV